MNFIRSFLPLKNIRIPGKDIIIRKNCFDFKFCGGKQMISAQE